jgi:protocatechuate 3,4-dioxygenase beta subunit/transposase-like protein
MASRDDLPAAARQELAPVLDEEVNRLPEETRLPFVLCCLEGKTYHQAARQLGCSPGTLARRLGQARQRLRDRLARRGLTLSAAGLAAALAELPAMAAVPPTLTTATVQAVMAGAASPALAAGAVAPQVAALVQGGLRAMAGPRWQSILALAVTVTVLAAGLAVWAQQTSPGPERATRNAPQAPPALKPQAVAPAMVKGKMAVTGRVRDAAGRPLPGAHVAVIGRPVFDYRRIVEDYRGPTVLGQSKADPQGRFRLVIPRTSQDSFWGLALVAASPGHALARAEIDVDAWAPNVDIRLGKEELLRGRVVDLQGHPVQGLQVHVLSVFKPYREPGFYNGVDFLDPPAALAVWPHPAVSDAQGRFVLRGIGPDWSVQLHTCDRRFARQHCECLASDRKEGKSITWALAQARTIEGTVTYADTGKPIPHARLFVETTFERNQGTVHRLPGRTDKQGRFDLVLPEGNFGSIAAFPPAGQPYLIQVQALTWTRGDVVKKGIKLSLPRGLLVRGTVTEKGSGHAVAGATVEFVRYFEKTPFFNAPGRSPVAVTSARGRFEIPVVPGRGHLLVKGPTVDYLHEEIRARQLYGRVNIIDWPVYPDAALALDLKPTSGTHHVAITLRRGVTLRGKVVGPDGKPVARAYLVCRTYLPLGFTLNGIQPRLVKDGRFELPGCDPDRPVQAFFLDVKNRQGAVVELSGKDAGKPLTVRLQPCGTARARLVNDRGQPLTEAYADAGIVLTPGCPSHLKKEGQSLAGVAHLDPHRYKPNAQGRVRLAALIPGAKLWLSVLQADGVLFAVHKEFQVEPGKTTDLGDIVVKKQGAP